MQSDRRQIDITTYQIRKVKADTSLCLFSDEINPVVNTLLFLGGGGYDGCFKIWNSKDNFVL